MPDKTKHFKGYFGPIMQFKSVSKMVLTFKESSVFFCYNLAPKKLHFIGLLSLNFATNFSPFITEKGSQQIRSIVVCKGLKQTHRHIQVQFWQFNRSINSKINRFKLTGFNSSQKSIVYTFVYADQLVNPRDDRRLHFCLHQLSQQAINHCK
jgi:hypothetical protein